VSVFNRVGNAPREGNKPPEAIRAVLSGARLNHGKDARSPGAACLPQAFFMRRLLLLTTAAPPPEVFADLLF